MGLIACKEKSENIFSRCRQIFIDKLRPLAMLLALPVKATTNQTNQTKMKTKQEITAAIEAIKTRGAWQTAVKTYAMELLEEMEGEFSAVKLLNGAANWNAYSYGGSALIYDADIAERVCSPSELKRKRGGTLAPNVRESWLDCQARALSQAARLISRRA
jgi:hypothetical protein